MIHKFQTVYFVYRPRRLADLRRPHFLERERPYEIVGKVTLEAIDFENFSEDMLADRTFLEAHAALCSEGRSMRFVQTEKCSVRILVVSDGAFVKWAAVVI